ncbi:MAG: MFS transporter [Phycisphaerae bacterium]|nr:MFS transporter [Phycisphaerae bacterium]
MTTTPEKPARLTDRFMSSSERSGVAVAFVYAFCLLASFSLLRPVRDEMGLRGGVKDLPWLFTGTFLVMLLVTPLFGAASGLLSRKRLLVGIYGFFILNLLVFYVLMRESIAPSTVAKSFFIWASVFNLYVVSLFWTFMADVFTPAQAKKLYGYIAAGASLGAIAGPAVTSLTVKELGAANLLLVAAATLILPIGAVIFLGNWLERNNPEQARRAPDRPIGGGVLDGIRLAFSSPLLLGLCGYFMLFTMLATFIYLERGRIATATFTESTDRTRFFANIDLTTNTLTLALQFGATRALLGRLGSLRALLILPFVTLLGLTALAISSTVAVLFGVEVLRRATDYAFARPARESLFTIVSREERYKAKNFIDTTVYRGGDMTAGWVDKGVAGMGVSALSFIAIPLAAAWIGLVAWLAIVARRTNASS